MRIGTAQSLWRYPVKSNIGVYATITTPGQVNVGDLVEVI